MGWLNLTIANQTVKNSLKTKKMTLPQFSILQKFKKILRADPELWWCTIFGSRKAHLSWTNCFKVQTIVITFYWPFSSCKILSVDPELCAWQFLGPKWPISPNENFFRKPVNEPCSFHSCLSTCQKSKWDINLLVKYWQLKNTEISLAESHFWL